MRRDRERPERSARNRTAPIIPLLALAAGECRPPLSEHAFRNEARAWERWIRGQENIDPNGATRTTIKYAWREDSRRGERSARAADFGGLDTFLARVRFDLRQQTTLKGSDLDKQIVAAVFTLLGISLSVKAIQKRFERMPPALRRDPDAGVRGRWARIDRAVRRALSYGGG